MASVVEGSVAYISSLCTVFVLYPYRDAVKTLHFSGLRDVNWVDFCMGRYRGMATNPSQPLLLAAPQGLLYGGYVFASGGLAGAILGGVLHGHVKMFVRSTANRMGGVSRYSALGNTSYSSLSHCIVSNAKHFGPLSFFCGGIAASVISIAWHGASLAVLQQSPGRSVAEDGWSAFRIHAFLTFLTAPLRNTFRSALHPRERASGVKTARDYVAGEVAVFREAGGVFQSMIRTEGIRFFLNGVWRTTFMTSIPFATTFALFKTMGGSIGPPGQRHNGSHGMRHHMRRF